MCGVLYFKGDSKVYKELIIQLLYQSRVRGLHAFGVSLRPSPEDDFQTVRTFNLDAATQYIQDNQFCELIGHCRYDTSGDWHVLGNNQPIVIGNSLLAFNGVIRMSTKAEYEEEFEQEYTTENDGEIVLRMLAEEDRRLMSLLEQKRVTFAGVAYVNGKALALRNERRPLWRAVAKGMEFVFSTRDIWERATKNVPLPVPAKLHLTEVPLLEAVWL